MGDVKPESGLASHDWMKGQAPHCSGQCSQILLLYFSVQFSRSVVSDSLRPHESQYAFIFKRKQKKKKHKTGFFFNHPTQFFFCFFFFFVFLTISGPVWKLGYFALKKEIQFCFFFLMQNTPVSKLAHLLLKKKKKKTNLCWLSKTTRGLACDLWAAGRWFLVSLGHCSYPPFRCGGPLVSGRAGI